MCHKYILQKSTIRPYTICCNIQCFRRDQFRSRAMEFIYSVSLIFIFIANILFFFSGICLIVLSISTLVYIGLRLISKERQSALDNAHLAALWARTTATTISTFNCLIFYWKNKTSRTEGMKVIKSMKMCPCFFYLRS